MGVRDLWNQTAGVGGGGGGCGRPPALPLSGEPGGWRRPRDGAASAEFGRPPPRAASARAASEAVARVSA